MDSERVEQLLAERSRSLGGALAGIGFTQRAKQALLAERARGLRVRRALRLGVAAAAALLLVLLWPDRGARPQSPLDVQVALLDEGGRDLGVDGGVRGGDPALPPPASLVLEVLAHEDGFVRAFLYDPQGRLRPSGIGAPRELTAGTALLLPFDLRGVWSDSDGAQELTWLILTAREPFAADAPGPPVALAFAKGPARRAAADKLAAQLASESGCSVSVRTLTHGAAR